MAKAEAKSLRSIFLQSQILVSLAVLSVVTVVLTILLLSLVNVFDQRRILELSQSIESQVLIAKTPGYLQQSTNHLIHTDQARGIIIYNKNHQIIAADALPPKGNSGRWLVADKALSTLVHRSLTRGEFGIHTHQLGSRHVSVLPLGPIVTESNHNVILGAKWPTPKWHEIVEKPQLTLKSLLPRILNIFSQNHSDKFKLSPGQYSGAIVLETSRDWVTSLVIKAVVVMSSLMALSIFVVLLVLSRVLRKNILDPVKKYTEVIAARRAGDYKSRVPTSNITEFDDLAFQWNSLLDFRDVAQGQNMVLSTLLEHVPVGIEVTDANNLIEYANPSFLKMTGYSLAEVIGQSPDILLASNKMDHEILGDSLLAIANGERWNGEITYARKDGQDIICNTTFVPIIGRNDKIERLITVHLDITKLKEDQKSLISAKTSAETADKAKSEFLTNMSHELRTPLNSIIGFSEMMAAQTLGPMPNPEYVEFSKLIETSSRTLLSSINLILDMSRLDAQRLQLNETQFCVSELLHKLIEAKSGSAKSLGVEIKRNLSCKHDICTDQRMLYQILGYLICNAVRYNKEGGQVLVKVQEANEKIVVTIKDNGIGISKKDLPKVLEPFYRVDSALDRMKDGAGLGLTLAKKFTKEQNIDFEMTSKLGKGTTVTLTFPVAISTSNPELKTYETYTA